MTTHCVYTSRRTAEDALPVQVGGRGGGIGRYTPHESRLNRTRCDHITVVSYVSRLNCVRPDRADISFVGLQHRNLGYLFVPVTD